MSSIDDSEELMATDVSDFSLFPISANIQYSTVVAASASDLLSERYRHPWLYWRRADWHLQANWSGDALRMYEVQAEAKGRAGRARWNRG